MSALQPLGRKPCLEELTEVRGGQAVSPAVAAELDRFYAFGYGDASVGRWLASPHPRLALATPAEALRAGGKAEVLAVLHLDLQRMREAR
jgi:hypothetical protein